MRSANAAWRFRSWDISQTLFRWPGGSETSAKRHVDRTRRLDLGDALLED
jgi:hypothetical protein